MKWNYVKCENCSETYPRPQYADCPVCGEKKSIPSLDDLIKSGKLKLTAVSFKKVHQ